MPSRETYRKIAALGRDLVSPAASCDESAARKQFLSLVWMRMMQGRNLIDPAERELDGAFGQFTRLLKQMPDGYGSKSHQFLADREDLHLAKPFWTVLRKSEFDDVWRSSDSAGWLYQYFNEPSLEVFRSTSAPKISPRQLAVRTQQFTPRWISEFLVQNSLCRLWLDTHPDSRLAKMCDQLVPLDPPRLIPPAKCACEIRILDPACGTLHLGLTAFAWLERIYREELENAGRLGWPNEPSVRNDKEIPDAIIRNNLFGIDLDPLMIEQATLTLFHAAGGNIHHAPHLCSADTLRKDMRMNLHTAGFPKSFDVVLLNPPYLDKRDYHPRLKTYMARHYKFSGRNLYTAFLERCVDFLALGGRLGAVTPQTFMFIHSFHELRRHLLDRVAIETLVHTGLNTFDDAVVDCAFYVLRREPTDVLRREHIGHFFQLTALNTPQEKFTRLTDTLDRLRRRDDIDPPHCHRYRQEDFFALPDCPWVYWTSPRIRRLFQELPTLGDQAELRQGLATTDNKRFLRFVWEIPRDRVAFTCRNLNDATCSGKKWFPYMKGGEYFKWYGNREYLVNWANDGREIKEEIIRRYPYLKGSWQWVAKNTEFYFREGITYSYLTSGRFSARYSPPGSIFDVAGSSIFCDDPHLILAILNSRFCRYALGLINPTVNFQVGDLQRLPVPAGQCDTELNNLVIEAIDLTRSLEAFEETSLDFAAPPPWPEGCRIVREKNRRLLAIQRQIDRLVYRLYKIPRGDQKVIESHTPPDTAPFRLDSDQLATRWLSYAVGVALSRFASPETVLSQVVLDDRQGLAAAVRRNLDNLLGASESQKIIAQVCRGSSLVEHLAKPFFDAHFLQYRKRPVYWLLKKRKALFVFYYQNLNHPEMAELLPRCRMGPIDFDDGIVANMKHFKRFFALSTWVRALQ